MGIAISVRNVSKSFRVHSLKNNTLKERVLYRRRERFRVFEALRDVSVDIPEGSTVALIGSNGSGKSTLLKIVSKILFPDSGTVQVSGRVASLLELGAGFHPDFSGKENIYLNGSLMGLSKKEITSKIDEIIEFSELGDFINEPIRSYSSGMYMRLAFSVATALDPDILLVDEILAVGDAPFQAKCFGRLHELQKEGKTIVIVTHDTGAVERLCDTAVWLHDSRVALQGEPAFCIERYLRTVMAQESKQESAMSFDRSLRADLDINSTMDGPSAASLARTGEYTIRRTEIRELGAIHDRSLQLFVSVVRESATEKAANSSGILGLSVKAGDLVVREISVLLKRISATVEHVVAFDLKALALGQGTYSLDVFVRSTHGVTHDIQERCATFSILEGDETNGIVSFLP